MAHAQKHPTPTKNAKPAKNAKKTNPYWDLILRNILTSQPRMSQRDAMYTALLLVGSQRPDALLTPRVRHLIAQVRDDSLRPSDIAGKAWEAWERVRGIPGERLDRAQRPPTQRRAATPRARLAMRAWVKKPSTQQRHTRDLAAWRRLTASGKPLARAPR